MSGMTVIRLDPMDPARARDVLDSMRQSLVDLAVADMVDAELRAEESRVVGEDFDVSLQSVGA